MKKSTKLKALVLPLIMATMLMLPLAAHAQSDGFLRDDGDYPKRDAGAYDLNNQTFGSSGYNLTNQTFGEGGYDLTNQTFGDDAPLGSGLLIMTIAGAGYAFRKRKNN